MIRQSAGLTYPSCGVNQKWISCVKDGNGLADPPVGESPQRLGHPGAKDGTHGQPDPAHERRGTPVSS